MSLQLRNVTSNNPLFSIQDVLSSYQSPHLVANGIHQITLFSDGCLVRGNPKQCREACSDPVDIFKSTSTLHNCLVLPVIASAFSKRQLDNASLLIAVDYGLDLSDSLFASNVRVNIQQCLTDYCSEQAGCGATICHGLSGDQCYNDTNICHSVYAPVIDDIAGVGIYTSYWMQNGIAVVAWAFLRLFDFWLYYALLVFFLLVDRNQAYERAERIRRTNLRYRIPNLISALIEFQKAQCFFMIAVQIAAIIIARKGGFGAQTLQQLSNSYSAITLLAICGYLPVVVTLVNLHGAGKSSWYLMVLSTITVVVSGVTLFTTRKFNPAAGDVAHLYNVTGHWASCGFHDPTTWCLDRQKVDPFSYPGGTGHAFIFCLIVLAFLFLDKLRTLPLIRKRLWGSGGLSSSTTKSHRQQTLTQESTLSRLSSVPYMYNRQISMNKKRLSNLLYGCVWVLFVLFHCRLLHLLFEWLDQSPGLIGPSTWTFGQIVGFTVWVPSLFQYLYLETCGMAAWFEQHIAGDYHIYQDKSPEEH